MITWKDIPNYDGQYKINDLGEIVSYKKGHQYKIKPTKQNGYYYVKLSKNGVKTAYTIHRLVATLFIDNPNNYPCVNHKDENGFNNNVDNLEWCTYKYNNTYNDRHKKYAYKTAYKLGNPVKQYDLNNYLTATYNSIIETCRQLNIPRTTLMRYIKNNKPYKGYIFKLED